MPNLYSPDIEKNKKIWISISHTQDVFYDRILIFIFNVCLKSYFYYVWVY